MMLSLRLYKWKKILSEQKIRLKTLIFTIELDKLFFHRFLNFAFEQ